MFATCTSRWRRAGPASLRRRPRSVLAAGGGAPHQQGGAGAGAAGVTGRLQLCTCLGVGLAGNAAGRGWLCHRHVPVVRSTPAARHPGWSLLHLQARFWTARKVSWALLPAGAAQLRCCARLRLCANQVSASEPASGAPPGGDGLLGAPAAGTPRGAACPQRRRVQAAAACSWA